MLSRKDTWRRELNFDIGCFGKTPKTKNRAILAGNRYHNALYKLLEIWQSVSAPEHKLYVEPWLRNEVNMRMLQPDAVLVHEPTNSAIVIEVKLNWKDGRDVKLVDQYLYATQSAFGLDCTWPALITKNVQYLPVERKPLVGLGALLTVDSWAPGQPCPVILVP